MEYEETKKWISLAEYKKITNKRKIELLNKYKSIDIVYKLLNLKIEIDLHKKIDYMNKKNIRILDYFSKNYPKNLKRIYDPPVVLYVLGNINILNNTGIAVIGTRRASNYGVFVAQKIGEFLSKNNINTISGLAIGIDANSHIGTLKENYRNLNSGKAVAIIGNGLDNIYPYVNQKLAREIYKNGGCIISEYIIGTKPEKNNFPARNRIISALADKLVVVEAENEKSGTMITVDFSLDMGKDILVVPGNITSRMSNGTNKLIESGAKIITELKDIII